METETLYQHYLQYPSVETDTRKIKPGDLFFALKGPHFNGNAFACAALEKGAALAVIDDADYRLDERTIVVEDSLTQLQKLAAFHRERLNIPFLAITGSNGKTTTKELVNSVLATTYRTYATEGNLNNHIGIPLTLLRIRSDIEVAVIEMGANHRQEIAGYCRMVKPGLGIITNIGKAHLEGFGGIEGIKKGKGELFDFLRNHGGAAFACSDFDYFREMTRGIRELYWYGTGENQYVSGKASSSDPFLVFHTDYTGEVATRLYGDYNLYNALAAVAVGKYFSVAAAKVKQAIAGYLPQNSRSQLISQGDNHIILDAYNANPSSMRAAIKNFAQSSAAKKVLVLGQMMELGKDSPAEHQALTDFISGYPWEAVVLVGEAFKGEGHPFVYLPDAAAAALWLNNRQFHGATILVKGSRAMAMEGVLAGSSGSSHIS